MRSSTLAAAAAALLALAALRAGAPAAPAAALPRTSDLASAPGGDRIGVLLQGAQVQLVERRGDWVRVSAEGWVEWPEAAGAGAPEAPPSGAPSPHSAAPAAPPAAARLSGSIFLTLEGARTVVGSGVALRLVTDPREAAGALAAVEQECGARREELRAEALRLAARADKAMMTIDSTSQAFQAYDEAKQERARTLDRLRALDRECGERAEAALESRTAARSLTDGYGRYHFDGVAPGRYLLRATLEAEGLRHDWELTVELVEGRQTTLDLTGANRTRTAPVPAYR